MYCIYLDATCITMSTLLRIWRESQLLRWIRNNHRSPCENNDPIIWAMLNSIKELKAENDALKARVGELERR